MNSRLVIDDYSRLPRWSLKACQEVGVNDALPRRASLLRIRLLQNRGCGPRTSGATGGHAAWVARGGRAAGREQGEWH